jgi:hypothetical protein
MDRAALAEAQQRLSALGVQVTALETAPAGSGCTSDVRRELNALKASVPYTVSNLLLSVVAMDPRLKG